MTLNKRKKFNTKRLEKTIKNKNTYYNFFLFHSLYQSIYLLLL